MACRGNVLLSVFETQTTYLRGNAVKYCSLSNGKNNIFLYIRQGDISFQSTFQIRQDDFVWTTRSGEKKSKFLEQEWWLCRFSSIKSWLTKWHVVINKRQAIRELSSTKISTMVTRTSGGWVWKVGMWSNRDENDYTLEIDKAQHYFYHIQFHLIYCFL